MSQSPIRRFLRPTRPWVWLLSVLVLYTLLGSVIAPLIVDQQAKKFVDEQLDLQVSFGRIQINPYTFSLEISEFELSEDSDPLLGFENLYLNFQLLSLVRSGLIDFKTIELSQLFLNLEQMEDGTTNIQALIERLGENTATEDTIETETEVSAQPLDLLLRNLSIRNSAIRLTDSQPQTALQIVLESIEFELQNFSLADNQTAEIDLALSLSSGGSLELEADLVVSPQVDLKMQIAVNQLALNPAQSYLSETTQIQLDSGLLDLSGEILSSAEEPFSYRGDLSFSSLDLQYQGESLLAWQQLLLPDNYFSISENLLEIAEVSLNNAYVRAGIDAEGTTNISEALVASNAETETEENPVTSAASATEPEEVPEEISSDPMAITIGGISINTSQMHFADFSLPLPFVAEISDLNGNISTISNTSTEPAEIEIDGQVGEFGLLDISGNLRPLNPKDLTNIDLNFENIDMVNMSPYLIKFAGQNVDSGKLSLDLGYAVENGQLEGSNNIILSDFTLGESIESPDAMNLPIGLALSLLKDGNGVIDIELPVSGDLNDPAFSFGSIINTAFTNLITSIVASPFKLLGGILGSEEPLDSIDFEAGEFELRLPEQEKLTLLSTALIERPQLRLQVSQAYKPVADQLALQEQELDRQVEERILQISDEELSDLDKRLLVLEALTGNVSVPAGPELDKLAYASELEQGLLDSSQVVTQLQFETLASNRAREIQSYLLESEPSLEGRITISPEITALQDDSEKLTILLSLTGT